jgi:hypothetical protein
MSSIAVFWSLGLLFLGSAWGIAVRLGYVAHLWVIWLLIVAGAVSLLVAGIRSGLLSPTLQIHLAEWGAGPTDGDYADVTKDVRGHISKDRKSISMRASDGVLGDFHPDKPKRLRVLYSFGSVKRRQVTVDHNDWLRLP